MNNLEIKVYNSLGVDLRGKTSGEIKTLCPFCSETRKNKKDLCLSVNIGTGQYNCHHCGKKGTIHEWTAIKEYRKPEAPKQLTFEDKAVNWWNKRGISKATLEMMKVIVTNRKFYDNDVPENCFCFQYFENNILINCKYRSLRKSFMLEGGAEIIPYNVDVIKENYKYLIITEGEPDALSWVEKGYKSVVSVPNGASENISYLDKYIELILKKEVIILAVDADQKGMILRDAIIKRLGVEKCHLIDYKGLKDTNEYLVKFKELKSLFDSGKVPQIEGIKDVIDVECKLDNLFETGYKLGVGINSSRFDELIKWELGKLAIVTGIPSMGKSEFVDFICVRLNNIHNWKVAYFSPETEQEIHIVKIIDKLTGKSFFNKEISPNEYNVCKEHIYKNYYWIIPKDENYTIDEILKNAEILIKTKGIKILVIDPYNTVEHQYSGNNETLYINTFLAKLSNFKRKFNILLFLVAHPRKMASNADGFDVPTLYDISGSANFYNKADYGLTQHISKNGNTTTYVQKVKNKWMGRQGFVDWIYNARNGRFYGNNEIEDNTSIFNEFNEAGEFKSLSPNANFSEPNNAPF